MVRPQARVLGKPSTEFGHDHDGDASIADIAKERSESLAEFFGQAVEDRALNEVGIPSAEIDTGDSKSDIGTDQAGRLVKGVGKPLPWTGFCTLPESINRFDRIQHMEARTSKTSPFFPVKAFQCRDKPGPSGLPEMEREFLNAPDSRRARTPTEAFRKNIGDRHGGERGKPSLHRPEITSHPSRSGILVDRTTVLHQILRFEVGSRPVF